MTRSRTDKTKTETSAPVYPYHDARNPQLHTDIVKNLLAGRRLFLSGGAGTGKTTLVRRIAETLSHECQKVVLTASTGLAACQLRDETGIHNSRYVKGPTTLHSAALLPITDMPDSSRWLEAGKRKLKKAAVIVIDEISMVDSLTFERFLQRVDPRTGLLAVGDFFQLPPVRRDEEGQADFAFHSPHFAEFELIELRTVLRQAEPHFVEFLRGLRDGRADAAVLAGAEGRFDADFPVLFGTNRQADYYNKQCMSRIEMPSIYSGCHVTEGPREKATQWLESQTRAKAQLEIKERMRVLCIQNHEELVNGDLGTVVDICERNDPGTELPCWVDVKFDRDRVGTQRLLPFEFQDREWDSRKKQEKVKLAVRQYPIVPAYGLTVHKAQGMTLEVVNIDGSRINFVPGHVYVALSRARTLDGIRLRNSEGLNAFCEPAVLDYYRNATRFDTSG